MQNKKILALILLLSISSYSQKLRLIDTSNYSIRKEKTEKIKVKNKLFNKYLKKKYKGKLRGEILKTYKVSDEEFLKNLRKNKFIFDERFTKYTDSIVKVITENNSVLNGLNISVYISKNPNINAFSVGKGIIILNIGLFKYFKNEDQLISVLTHEIAHETQKHVAKNIVYKARLQTSKNSKTQALKIRKQRYKKYSKSFKILKDLLYSDSKANRVREMQADSLGYLYYKKTLLYKPNYISALQLLAKYKNIPNIKLDSSVYKSFFNLPKQPFKKSWLAMEEFSAYDYSNYKEKINKDSIKSHPEFAERIEKMKKDFSELNFNDSITETKNKNFLILQKLAQKEDVAHLYDMEEYGKSIRLILYKLSKSPEDAYLKKWLGKNFLSLYEAKKKYQLNRYVERLNPKEQTKNYQQFLNFIWNLTLNEIKFIGDYYSKN